MNFQILKLANLILEDVDQPKELHPNLTVEEMYVCLFFKQCKNNSL